MNTVELRRRAITKYQGNAALKETKIDFRDACVGQYTKDDLML
jgi:hypothetical protein